MEKLTDIILELQEVIEKTSLNISDAELLENAVKIYISGKISESKKENINQMKDRFPINRPTPKQLNLIKKLNLKVNPQTKQEATQIIKEYIENNPKEL